MKRFLPLFFLAACGAYVPPCDETNPLLHGCDREDRAAFQRPVVEPSDPEPPGCKNGKDCAGGFERDPDAYHEWRDRQGRPLK